MTTVYISIGNSDDKLTQQHWGMFQIEILKVLREAGAKIHGEWHSHGVSPYQNACWCVEVVLAVVEPLKEHLLRLAFEYNQDSIAWAEAPVTEFLEGVKR